MIETPLLQVQDLHVRFPVRSGLLQRETGSVKAVSGVSFEVRKGEAFGIVGESGCGKTTVARAILRLEDATEGRIIYDGEDMTTLSGTALSSYRRKVQAVFQDPFSSLNPRSTTARILSEPLTVHGLIPPSGVKARISELLELVELPARFAELYPHEMSGGQRQRVGIARALAMQPETIVCDEAVSALDVSIQAQIINLLERLRRELGLTYVFIGHDLSVVRHLCSRVAVMYLGRVMETAGSDPLFAHPAHPYTQALIDAVPDPDPDIEGGRTITPLPGEIPSPTNPPPGCVFHTRCPLAFEPCDRDVPPLEPVALQDQPAEGSDGRADNRHLAACWLTGPDHRPTRFQTPSTKTNPTGEDHVTA